MRDREGGVRGGGKRARAGKRKRNTSFLPSFFSLLSCLSLSLGLYFPSPRFSFLPQVQFVMSLKTTPFSLNFCVLLFWKKGAPSVSVCFFLLSLDLGAEVHFFSFPFAFFRLFFLFMLSAFRRLSSVPRSTFSSSLRAPASRQHFRSSVVAMASSSAFFGG